MSKLRFDEWYNSLTGVGVAAYDRNSGARYYANMLSEREIDDLWQTNSIAAKIIELPPREMLRAGVEIVLKEPDEDLTTKVEEAAEAIDLLGNYMRSRFFERAFGGAAMLLGFDTADWTSPLGLGEALTELRYLTVLRPSEAIPVSWYDDPRQPKFGEPNVYRVSIAVPGVDLHNKNSRGGGTIFDVHESRILKFRGIRTADRGGSVNRWGWGISHIERVYEAIRGYGLTWPSVETLIQDFAPAVLKLKGLADALAQDHADAIKERIRLMATLRSTLRAAIIDADGEEYQRTQTPITGLPEMVQMLCQRLSIETGIPVTKLMGVSPGGMNATGESDTRNWYDELDSERNFSDRPKLTYLYSLIMQSTKGPLAGKEPDGWKLKFCPLWQPTEKESAEARKIQAETDQIYINSGVLYPEEVTESRFAKGEYSFETDVDMATRSALEDATERGREEGRAEAMMQQQLEPSEDLEDE